MIELRWESIEDCEAFAAALAAAASPPLCIALVGTLGAGKTQLVKSFVAALGGDPTEVSSPTFVLVHQYYARHEIVHADLYRLQGRAELDNVGLEDLIYGEAVSLIEWADKFPDVLPPDSLWITIRIEDDGTRLVTLQAEDGTIAAGVAQEVARVYASRGPRDA